MPDAIKRLIVAQAIIWQGDRLLLVQNKWPDGLHWGLPGGTMEYNEALPDVVTREVQEETGLAVQVTGVAYIHEKKWQDTYGMFITCTTRVVGGTLRAPDDIEIADLGFFEADRACAMIDLPDIRGPLEGWLESRAGCALHFVSDSERVYQSGGGGAGGSDRFD